MAIKTFLILLFAFGANWHNNIKVDANPIHKNAFNVCAHAIDTSKAIWQMCEEIQAQYPMATLQDIYKTCYQDFFGAEHLMTDTAAARAYLQQELKAYASTDMNSLPEREATGFRHRFIRINLSVVLTGKMSEDELLSLFIDAAGKDNAYGDNWYNEWKAIEQIALQVNPKWQNEELQTALRNAAKSNQAVRHSEAFRKSYNPHYRIIRNR